MAAASQRPDAPRMACVRCLELAERWLTACSATACVRMIDAFANFTDEALADLCISRWGLDQPQGEENDLTWFEAHEASRDFLVWAFAAFRAFTAEDQSER